MESKKLFICLCLLFTSFFNGLLAQQETVEYNRGKFVNIGNDRWDEINSDGTHHFKEIGRTNNTITLNKITDPGLTFVFNFNQKAILYNGSVWSPIKNHNVGSSTANVNSNVSAQEIIHYEWGKFVHKNGDQWEEVNKDGKHPFREIRRAGNKITLNKITDNSWTFILDLNTKTVLANGSAWSKITNHNVGVNSNANPNSTPNSNSGSNSNSGTTTNSPPAASASVISFVEELRGHLSGSASSTNNAINLSVSVKNISFDMMLRELGKTDPAVQSVINAIPAALKNLMLNEVTGKFIPQKRKVEVIMKSSIDNFPVTFQAAIQKDNASSKNDAMSFVVGVQPGSFNQVLELIGISPENLKDFTKYFDLSAGILFSTMDGKIVSQLPIFNNQEVGKGLNMRGTATVNFDELGGSQDQKDLIKKVIGTTALSLTANVPNNPTDTELGAEINTNFNLLFKGDPFITFNGGNFKAMMSPTNPTFSVGSTVTLHIKGKDNQITKLTFGGNGTIKPVNSSFGIGLTFKGEDGINGTAGWKNPFGFPGITVLELGGEVNLEALIPWVSGGLRGKVNLGTNPEKEIKGSVGLMIDPNNPQNCLLDLDINNLSIAGLIDAFDIVKLTNSDLRKGLNSGIKNLKVYVAPTTMILAKEKYKQGIEFNAEADIYGWNAKYNALLNPENLHLNINGTMDDIHLKHGTTQILSLTGASTKYPKPILHLEVSKDKFPTATMSGKVTVLKTGNQQALLQGSGEFVFNENELSITTNGGLFQGDIQASCDLKATNYSDLAKANYKGTISVKDKGEMRAMMVKIFKQKSKESQAYADMLKAASSPNKPILESYRQVYHEYQKAENELSNAAVYVLEKGFVLNSFLFDASLNQISTSLTLELDAMVAGQRVNESVRLKIGTLELSKVIEEAALTVLKQFEQEGNNLVKGLENELAKVNKEMDNFLKGIGVIDDGKKAFKVSVDFEHSKIDYEGTSNTITVSFLDKNEKLIDRVSHSHIENKVAGTGWIDFEIRSNTTPYYIKFETNGDNGFYVDRFVLYTDNSKMNQFGENDGQDGWAFSTDPNDSKIWIKGGALAATAKAISNQTFPFQYKEIDISNPIIPATYFKVSIDFEHANIENEGTTNTITVEFLAANKSQIGKISHEKIYNQAFGTGWIDFETKLRSDVKFVRIKTNGSDAFYVDRFQFWKGGKLITTKGKDNGDDGWVLSTDPSDADGWKNSNAVKRLNRAEASVDISVQ